MNEACANIAWLKEQHITKPADGRYHPKASVTRGSMAAFLFRLTHPDTPSPVCRVRPFPDVSTSNVFCGYIAWAKRTHVAFGYADGSYQPNRAVTRGAMAAYLHRIATDAAAPACTAKPYADVAVGSLFCRVITWAKDAGITYGFDATHYGTTRPVTRQAMASFLHRTFDLMHSGLAGTTFWARTTDDGQLNTAHWLGFLSGGWAYYGVPLAGTPRCTHITTAADDRAGVSCVRYTYDAGTGAVTLDPIDGHAVRGALHGHVLDITIGKASEFRPLVIPQAGATFDADVVNYPSSGLCGVDIGCGWHETRLILSADGTFVLPGGLVPGQHLFGDVHWPDGTVHGTYRIGPRGAATFTADGSSATVSIGIATDAKGVPHADGGPQQGGIVLDDRYFAHYRPGRVHPLSSHAG